jgi:hypothetical protein
MINKEINSFFTSISNNDKGKNNKVFEFIIYVCTNEFGWTQKEFEECEIPYLVIIFNKRYEDLIRQQKRR